MPFQFECYSLNVAARMAQRSAGEGWWYVYIFPPHWKCLCYAHWVGHLYQSDQPAQVVTGHHTRGTFFRCFTSFCMPVWDQLFLGQLIEGIQVPPRKYR